MPDYGRQSYRWARSLTPSSYPNYFSASSPTLFLEGLVLNRLWAGWQFALPVMDFPEKRVGLLHEPSLC